MSKKSAQHQLGQTEEQQEAILKDFGGFVQKVKEKGLIFVQADQSPEDIYKIVAG